MHPFQPRLVTDAAMTVRCDFVDDRLAADSRNRRFARRINIGDHHAVGIVEGAPEFFAQRLRARITMRLKHGQHALASDRSRGLQRGAGFRSDDARNRRPAETARSRI